MHTCVYIYRGTRETNGGDKAGAQTMHRPATVQKYQYFLGSCCTYSLKLCKYLQMSVAGFVKKSSYMNLKGECTIQFENITCSKFEGVLKQNHLWQGN